MNRYIVDASVALKWFFAEDHSESARRIHEVGVALHVPKFFFLECGNVVCRKIRRAEVSISDGLEFLQDLRRVPIEYHEDDALFPGALDLALIINLGLYDCLYLALAVELGGILITADRRFYDAINASAYASYALWVEDLPVA